MRYFNYSLLAVAILIISCKNNDVAQEQGDPRLVVPFTQQTNTGLQSQSTSVATQNHNLFHENNNGIASSVAAGINPAHGQPNHRCDIAVGAPLNSSVNESIAVQPTNGQSTPMGPTQNSPAKTVTAKGMNPPHGEKNHRCDIAVGAPLNSSSTTAKATNSTQSSQEYTVQQPVPTLLSTATADTETPPGINPAHGKEGHRCDVAVGDPLPKS
ncbi:hypothetical protein AB3G33_05930 [Flavobacterium sp. WC2421]|jgi:hypothetical protein|uniref:Uncharacterized protein n=1 Tax=Flavobacterium sp. WC2409 TaxID=3234139 RepID=A0AB39W0W4_9FLAO